MTRNREFDDATGREFPISRTPLLPLRSDVVSNWHTRPGLKQGGKQSGGYICVDSEVGHGSSFKVYLPLIEEAVLAAEAAVPAPESFRGCETVLVVEDAEALRKLSVTLLEEHGYQVLSAANGAEALELAKKDNRGIDLLLTDVIMPGPEAAAGGAVMHGQGDLFFGFLAASTLVFAVDTDISGCYKPQKGKFFGGESPNELQSAVASEAADLPGRAGLLSRPGSCHATPHPPREVRTNLFSPPFCFGDGADVYVTTFK